MELLSDFSRFILDNLPKLVLMAGLLCCSSFFSASETAFFSVSREARRRLKASGARSSQLVLRILSNPQELLIAVLFGNMLVNTLYFSISAIMALGTETAWQAGAIGLGSLCAIITFGEVIPKNLAIHFSEQLARLAAFPLCGFQTAILPVRKVLGGIVRLLTYRPREESRRAAYVTPDELKMLVDVSAEQGVIDRAERDMIEQVVELGTLRVKEIMVPRVDVVCFDVARGLDELREAMRRARHKEIPVFEGSVDNVIGIVRATDVLSSRASDVRSLICPPLFVPELAAIDRILRLLRTQKKHVAIAVDEYGGFAGLVTLEDIVDEIVGDVPGEASVSGQPVEKLGRGRYRLPGNLSIRDWAGLFDIQTEFPRFDTLAGLVMFLLGRVPQEGDTVKYGNLTFRVEKARRGRVVSVFVEMRTSLTSQFGAEEEEA